MRTLFLHGPTVWKVMPRNAWSDIVSWPTGQLNNSTKYLLNDVSLPVLWGRSLHELRSHWQSLIYELHQCSSHWHHEVLDEEDDECHLLYWWKRIGSGRSSPDSRWRRCIFVSASRKCDRSFIGAFLPDLFMVKNQFSDISRTLQAVDNRNDFPIRNARLLSPANFELRITILLIFFRNDREFLQISFRNISFEHCRLWIQFCRAEHLEVAPSW